MKSVNIITKAPQVRLKRNNNKGIRRVLCYTAVVLGIMALLIGCPDDAGTGNGDSNDGVTGTPTEATLVQSAVSGAISVNSITLNWTVPTDTDGYMGVTISEQNNAGSLSSAVDIDAETTTYTVTDLEADTEYTFTIATRYTASGKNNSITIEATTASVTEVQNVALDASATTSDSVTITWQDPVDTTGYTGVMIRIASNIGGFTTTETVPDADTDMLTISGLTAGTEHTLTLIFTTQYSTDSKNSDSTHTITVTTQSNAIDTDTVTTSAITSDSVTIAWADPEDAAEYTQVAINAASTVDGFTTDATVPAADPNTLTISGLTADTAQTLTLTFTTTYSGTKQGGSSEHTIDITTQSNVVTAVVASNTDATTITLSWADPEDRVRYSGVMVTGGTMAGVMITPQTVSASEGSTAQQVAIMGLTADTDYTFTLATQYADDDAGNSKTGDSVEVPTRTRNPIDIDGDGLVDINSLERLDNMRYNLDLGEDSDDGRYKESTQTAENAGLLCGDSGTTPCTGYELTRSLNFADGGSYEGGSVNTEWRPNASDPDDATNAGWDPIGDCNTDTADGATLSCGDADDTPFAARFEGNGFTISNLYARNTTTNNGSAIGLFGITAATATIRSLGVQGVALYSGSRSDRVGGIVGLHGGTIVGSYASGGSVDSNTDSSIIGGLVGHNNGSIIASYAAINVISNGANSTAGGLLGISEVGTIVIASYASSTVAENTIGQQNIGGLVGNHLDSSAVIIASYASGAVDGHDSGSSNFVGGITSIGPGIISASYATGSVNGGVSAGTAGALRSFGGAGNTNFNYGFGTVTNNGSGGYDGTDKPTVDGTEDTAVITMARQLTLTNAGAIWNDADNDTLNAWDFGDNSQDPALRYADYDGTDTDYGCIDASNPTSAATIVIPAIVASPSGPLEIVCGETLLPGQRP